MNININYPFFKIEIFLLLLHFFTFMNNTVFISD